MPDEIGKFQTNGLSWSERAAMGPLNGVLSPTGSAARNNFLHAVNLVGARKTMSLDSKGGTLVDFGCGSGRFFPLFTDNGFSVVGIEITFEMLRAAHQAGPPKNTLLLQTNGIDIPLKDASVDMVWACGVLRFSLFIEDPVYRDIAREMYRVLRPGGHAVNLEMYVENEPEIFESDFRAAGFVAQDLRVLQRYDSRMENFLQSPRLPLWCVRAGGSLSATLRYWFDRPRRKASGLRDYLFVWTKPTENPNGSQGK